MKKILIFFLMLIVVINVNAIAKKSTTTNTCQEKIIIALIGDSTVTDDVGWGKSFAKRFNDKVKVLNFSIKGSSSKSFYDKKFYIPALKAKPDYVLIQFGHNDQPGKGPDRETDPSTTYSYYLFLYVKMFQEIGAKPILVSSVTRRTFGKNGKISPSLLPWANAVRRLATEIKVPFIDLHTASINFHNKIGEKASMKLNAEPKDKTHLNQKGADAIANLVVEELKKAEPSLAKYLK